MAKGKFIVFEGIDGCGKTTQAHLLIDRLKKMEIDVSPYCHDPSTSTVLTEAFQHLRAREPFPPMAAALLFASAHVDIYQRFVAPRLKAGRWVVMDRFIGSTLVYQAPALPSGFAELYFRILQFAGIQYPDLTVVLDRKPYFLEKTPDPYALPEVLPADSLREHCWKNLDEYRTGFANLGKWFELEWVGCEDRSKEQVHEIVFDSISTRFLKGED